MVLYTYEHNIYIGDETMTSVNFATNLLFFWIKGQVEVDNRFVKTNVANTIFNIIPAGKDQQSIPLKNISGATLSTKFNGKAFILGIIILFIGLMIMSEQAFGGFLLLVAGVVVAANGILTTLTIEKAGTPHFINVPFFEKSKMQSIKNDINNALADDVDKTDLNFFMDKKAE